MKLFKRRRREPVVEATVLVTKSQTAGEAMLKMARFTNLCNNNGVEVVVTPMARASHGITVSGRESNVKRFVEKYNVLVNLGSL